MKNIDRIFYQFLFALQLYDHINELTYLHLLLKVVFKLQGYFVR